MPAVSRAQQRLMQAAEHGANFPMARKLRQSMTHQQLHDFAVGSEATKPQHVSHARSLHPAMQKHARMVSEAHAHLSKAVPEYSHPATTPRQRMLMVQEHVRTRKRYGY